MTAELSMPHEHTALRAHHGSVLLLRDSQLMRRLLRRERPAQRTAEWGAEMLRQRHQAHQLPMRVEATPD